MNTLHYTTQLPLTSVQVQHDHMRYTVMTDCTEACRLCWGNTHVTSRKWVWSAWVKLEVTNSWTILQRWMCCHGCHWCVTKLYIVMLVVTFSDVCGEADVCPKVNSGHVWSDGKAHSDTNMIINVGVAMQPHPQNGFPCFAACIISELLLPGNTRTSSSLQR